jgi:osmotically-inducible protein OsmY
VIRIRLVAASMVVAVSALALSGCAGVVIGAGASAGVAAAEERGLEGAIDDTKIRVQINDLWFRRDVEMYRKVGLDIHEGRVMLTGVVPNDEARAEAVRLTWQAAGVREVYNEISVDPQGEALMDRSRDTWIEQKFKAKLLFDRDIKNINYVVNVVDGTVYLMGVAQNQAEIDQVVAYARDIANVQRVVSHIVLKDDPGRVNR